MFFVYYDGVLLSFLTVCCLFVGCISIIEPVIMLWYEKTVRPRSFYDFYPTF